MLERLVAFGIVVVALFGLAAFLNEDEAAPGETCPEAPGCAPEESRFDAPAPACPEGCAPASPPKGAPLRLLPGGQDDDDDDDDDEEDEEREEKRDREKRRGKKGRD